jgi:hypothetical protein
MWRGEPSPGADVGRGEQRGDCPRVLTEPALHRSVGRVARYGPMYFLSEHAYNCGWDGAPSEMRERLARTTNTAACAAHCAECDRAERLRCDYLGHCSRQRSLQEAPPRYSVKHAAVAHHTAWSDAACSGLACVVHRRLRTC